MLGNRYTDDYDNVWEVVDESAFVVTLREVVTGETREVDRDELKSDYRPIRRKRGEF